MPLQKKGQSALDDEHVPVKYLQGLGLNHDLAERLSAKCIDAGELMSAAKKPISCTGLLLDVPEPRSKGSDDPYRLPPPMKQNKQQARMSIARLSRPLGVDDPQGARALRKSLVAVEKEELKCVETSGITVGGSSTARGSNSLAPEGEAIIRGDKLISCSLGLSQDLQAPEVQDMQADQKMQTATKQKKPAKWAPLGLRPQDCVEEPPEGWYRFKDVLEAQGDRLGQLSALNESETDRADKPGAAKNRVDNESHPLRIRQAGARKRRTPHSARALSSMSQRTPRLPHIPGATGATERVNFGVLESAMLGHVEDTKMTSLVRDPRWMRTGGVC